MFWTSFPWETFHAEYIILNATDKVFFNLFLFPMISSSHSKESASSLNEIPAWALDFLLLICP